VAKKFFIDQDAGLFVVGPQDSSALPKITLKNKDAYSVQLYMLRQTGVFGRPYSFDNLSTATISIGLGQLSVSPVATALITTNLPTVVTATITTVIGGSSTTSEVQKISFSSKPSGGIWQITMAEDSRTLASAVTAGVFITTAYHGFRVNQPIVFPTLTGNTGVTANIQYYVYDLQAPDRFRIALTASGTLMVVTAATGTVSTPARSTQLLTSYADAADVQASLEALDTVGDNNVAVAGVAGEYFYLSFRANKANSNFPPVTVSDTTLLPQYGKSGTLSLSVSGLQTLIDASGNTDAVDLTLEVQVEDPAGFFETYATTIKAVEDLL
jgi:hypothetical protein